MNLRSSTASWTQNTLPIIMYMPIAIGRKATAPCGWTKSSTPIRMLHMPSVRSKRKNTPAKPSLKYRTSSLTPMARHSAPIRQQTTTAETAGRMTITIPSAKRQQESAIAQARTGLSSFFQFSFTKISSFLI